MSVNFQECPLIGNPSQSYTKRHMPYGITQFYQPPNTGERSSTHPSSTPPEWSVLNSSIPERRKAELTLVLVNGYIPKW